MRLIAGMLLMVAATFGHGQDTMDTIEVSTTHSATMLFDSNIKKIVYGNNPIVAMAAGSKPVYEHYDEFRLDNKAVITANSKEAPFNTISVILENGELFWGFLRYSDAPAQVFYDFRPKKEEKADIQESESLTAERLSELMTRKQEYDQFGRQKNGIELLVTNMMNDSEHTYIKLMFNNNTSGQYTVKGITFRHEESRNKNATEKAEESQYDETKRINPVERVEPSDTEVKAYSSGEFGYAIPLYSTESGKLIITIYELNGTRELTVKIRARDMSKIKVF